MSKIEAQRKGSSNPAGIAAFENFRCEPGHISIGPDHVLHVLLHRRAKDEEQSTQDREKTMMRIATHLAFLVVSLVALPAVTALADDPQVARGKYLVTIGGCNDCHTPGYFLGKPDMSRFLGGSDVGFEIPGQGVFVGPNITPDKETGIGNWSREQIVTAIQTGKRPDGRILAPIMPWHAYGQLTADDASAVAAFLQSLQPVSHRVPAPVSPGEKVSTFMLRILPPGETAAAR
jgi:mono/diheme cytochrome c family protein